MLIRTRFLTVLEVVCASILIGCTGSTSAPTTRVDTAVGASAPAASETSVPPIAISTTEVKNTSGWTSEPIGTYSQFIGGADLVAFAPDGGAVSFLSVDTSCCSSATSGWARRATESWQPIENSQELFVSGTTDGAFGGPTDVVWFRDQFVAVGARGGGAPADEQSDGLTPAIPTIWTSPDGLTWTATEQPGSLTPTQLQVSLSSNVLFGVWTAGDNIEVRSTSDGTTWETISTLSPFATGQTLYPTGFASISSADDKPANYLITGTVSSSSPSTQSFGFVAVSKDGETWSTRQLSTTQGTSGSSADHALFFDGKIIVYGTAYSEQEDGTQVDTAVGWTSTDGGLTFTELPLQTNCGGAFSSAVIDRAAPEPTLFAVCTTLVGPQEGDYISSTDQLLFTRDGVVFETPPNMSPEWSTPSENISIGPLSLDNGRVVLPVATPNGDTGRRVTLWRA
jgi:hypothetical protein